MDIRLSNPSLATFLDTMGCNGAASPSFESDSGDDLFGNLLAIFSNNSEAAEEQTANSDTPSLQSVSQDALEVDGILSDEELIATNEIKFTPTPLQDDTEVNTTEILEVKLNTPTNNLKDSLSHLSPAVTTNNIQDQTPAFSPAPPIDTNNGIASPLQQISMPHEEINTTPELQAHESTSLPIAQHTTQPQTQLVAEQLFIETNDSLYTSLPLTSLQEIAQPNKLLIKDSPTSSTKSEEKLVSTTAMTESSNSLNQDFKKVEAEVFAPKVIGIATPQQSAINTDRTEENFAINANMAKPLGGDFTEARVLSTFQSNAFKSNRFDNNVAEQISFKVIKSIHNKTKITTFELEPANLGKIEIKFEETTGKNPSTILKILTEKFTTFDSISKTIPHIESILRDTGIKGEINIEMGLKDFNTPNFAKGNNEFEGGDDFSKNVKNISESEGNIEVRNSNYNGQLSIYI